MEILGLILYLSLAHYYLLIFALLLYVVFWYYSGAETTGYEAKNGFRNWSIWHTHVNAVRYIFSSKEEFSDKRGKRRLLFILTSNATNMPLISGFGLHGGVFKGLDLRFVVSTVLTSVPIVRELLLWMGAVSASHDRDVTGVILKLLENGKSVAYCPANKDMVIPNDIFDFAQQNQVYLVPVLVQKEELRYSIYGERFIAFFPQVFGSNPPPKVDLIIGMPMNPEIQQDVETFKRLFQSQIDGFLGV